MVGILQSWMRKDGIRIMAKKKAVRRENGRGTVEKVNSKKNPFRAKVPVGTKVDKNGKTQAVYKILGNFPTRVEAENALADFSRTPYELTSTVKTFADLYEVWSKYYDAMEQGYVIPTMGKDKGKKRFQSTRQLSLWWRNAIYRLQNGIIVTGFSMTQKDSRVPK